MKIRSNARIIRIAIAGSLAAHILFAAIVHSRPVTAAPEQKPSHGEIIVLVLPKPTPTPPPKLQTTKAQRKPAAARRPVMHLTNTHPTRTGKVAIAIASALPGTPEPSPQASTRPGPQATQEPVIPSPTPKPACSAPDVAAKAIDTVTPQAPEDEQGIAAQTKVKVDLDASGSVTGASVYSSSGYMQLDQAAVRAAKQSRYAPEEHDCKNIPGSYLFTVDFSQ